MQTDKPLYKPGDKVLIRVLAVNVQGGLLMPYTPAGTNMECEITVKNPKNIKI